MVSAAAGSVAAQAPPKSKAKARASGKLTCIIVLITPIIATYPKWQQSQPRHSPVQRSARAGARKAIFFQLNTTLVAEAVSEAGLSQGGMTAFRSRLKSL